MPVYPCLCVLMCLCVCFVPLVRPRDITIGGPSSFCVGICMFVCVFVCDCMYVCLRASMYIFLCNGIYCIFAFSVL